MSLQDIYNQRARAHAELTQMLGLAQRGGAVSREKMNKLLAGIEDLTQQIEQQQRLNAIFGTREVGNPEATKYRSAYMEVLRYGQPGERSAINGGASAASLAILRETRTKMSQATTKEQRDQLAGTQSITYTDGSVGGYFVPAGFVYDIDEAAKFYADLLNVVGVIKTDTGNLLPYPTDDDTTNAWHILGEGSQIVDEGTSDNYPTQGTLPTTDAANVGFSNVKFNAFKGSTGMIRVSLELMQDSAFEFESYLTRKFATRLGRGYEAYLTNGGGSTMPTGILPAIAASGATTVTATGSSANDGNSGNTGANSIGYDDLVSLIHSVDPTYRRSASTRFMFHDQTLAHLKTRLDKYGKPLWVPSTIVGEPDRIAGFPYVINQSFPQIGASKVTVAFGDWSKFIVRKVKELQILRLDERFADYGEVGFLGFSRIDSNLVDAGTHPLNTLTQAS
jgi:HK97 family phage major capsid protein